MEDAARDAGWRAPRDARGAGVARRPRRAPGRRAAVRLARGRACATTPSARWCPTPTRPGASRSSPRSFDGETAALGPVVPVDGDLAKRRPRGGRAAPGRGGPAPGRRPGGHGPAPARAGPAARPAAARRPGRVQPGARSTAAPRARAPRLLETLRGWIDHQGRVPDVARALHVHPADGPLPAHPAARGVRAGARRPRRALRARARRARPRRRGAASRESLRTTSRRRPVSTS